MEDSHYHSIFKMESAHWWYRVRREIAIDSLRSVLKNNRTPSLRILDVGCGAGGLMKELRLFGEVYGIDIADRVVEFCKNKGILNVSAGSITAIPYPDNSFDVVFALDVIEHIQDDEMAMCEIYRVLRLGGSAIISVPAFQSLWGITDELSHHVRRYRRIQIAAKLKKAGFQVGRATYFNTFLFAPIASIRFLVRALNVKMKSENSSFGFMNKLLYFVFHLESKLLRVMDLPFGISILLVARKKELT